MKITPKIRLYSLTPYDRGAKARWLLDEMGVAYETKLLDREKREHEEPAFLRLNPMGRVPVLEMDDVVIHESGAILEFLADRFPEGGLAPLPSDSDRAAYLQWLYFAASTLDPVQTRIMIIEDIPPGEVFEAKQSALQEFLGDSLDALDRTFAKGDFLLGNRFSAADISVSYHLFWIRLWPELDVVLRKYPRVIDYLERMKKRTAAVRSQVFAYPG
ncbi:MAG: glutathione S-transferase family protein [Bdellovibrionales bacterium]|nr:glutathione S-transferase family protein [Bdellovibrionales bacterium]